MLNLKGHHCYNVLKFLPSKRNLAQDLFPVVGVNTGIRRAARVHGLIEFGDKATKIN